MPALNLGHIVVPFVNSITMSTGHLSNPGVTLFHTKYASKEDLDSEIQQFKLSVIRLRAIFRA